MRPRRSAGDTPSPAGRATSCSTCCSASTSSRSSVQGCLQFVEAFPAARASLARTLSDADGNRVADRFELFIDGCEIANGYHELLDARRAARAHAGRQRRSGARVVSTRRLPLDERLLAAMAHGLPPCAGVALGRGPPGDDRPRRARDIDDVLAFSAHRA
jgi:hypothetical protein